MCEYLEGKHENVPSDISLIIHVNKHTEKDVSVDLDQMPHSVAYNQGLHCLPLIQ